MRGDRQIYFHAVFPTELILTALLVTHFQTKKKLVATASNHITVSAEDYKSQRASFQSTGRGDVLNDKISAAISWSTVKQQTYRLLYEVNAGLQIQAKVNEIPLYALPLVLLLLQNEHGVVKELLQLFICVVNTQLLKGVQLMKKKVERCLSNCLKTHLPFSQHKRSSLWFRNLSQSVADSPLSITSSDMNCLFCHVPLHTAAIPREVHTHWFSDFAKECLAVNSRRITAAT